MLLLALQCKTYTKIDGTSRTGELLSTINVPDAFKIGSVAVGPISLKHPRVGALKVGGCGARVFLGVPAAATLMRLAAYYTDSDSCLAVVYGLDASDEC